jgi:hypothetical protein
MSARAGRASPGPCAKVVLWVFGSLFLIALLSVPVTTKTSQVRQAPDSNLIVRTTFPRNSTMFLPQYLAVKGRPGGAGDVQVRSTQWVGTMAIVLVLGVFDYVVICRLLWRRRRPKAADAELSAPSLDL